jgi:hypothetical protein
MGLSYAQQYPVVALTGSFRSVGSFFALLNSFPPGEYPPAAQLLFILVASWFVACTVLVEFWWIARHATLLARSIPLRLLILFLGMFTLFLSGVALVSAVIRGSEGAAIGLYSFNVVLNVVYTVVLLRFYCQFFTPKNYFGYGPEAIPRASEPQAGDVEQEYRDEEDGDVVKGPLYQLYETLRVASVPPVDLDQNENEGMDLLLDAEVDVVASDQPADQRSPPGPSWRPEREASCRQQTSYEPQVVRLLLLWASQKVDFCISFQKPWDKLLEPQENVQRLLESLQRTPEKIQRMQEHLRRTQDKRLITREGHQSPQRQKTVTHPHNILHI